MSNYDQRGQKNYGTQYYAGRDIHHNNHHHYPGDSEDKQSRFGRALFLGVLYTFLMTLFADWGKIIITGGFNIVFGPHSDMDFWSVIGGIAQYSYPWPFYIGLALGMITFLSYLIFGKSMLQSSRRY